jgi:hypothetical protein
MVTIYYLDIDHILKIIWPYFSFIFSGLKTFKLKIKFKDWPVGSTEIEDAGNKESSVPTE